MQIEVATIVSGLAQAAVIGIAGYAVSILSKLRMSIDELTVKVAVVIEKTTWHEKELSEHKSRLEYLEREK